MPKTNSMVELTLTFGKPKELTAENNQPLVGGVIESVNNEITGEGKSKKRATTIVVQGSDDLHYQLSAKGKIILKTAKEEA